MTDISKLTPEEQAVILARRSYQKKWRENNKDKVKAANERFFKKQLDKLAVQPKEKPSE